MTSVITNARNGTKWEIINFVATPRGIHGLAMVTSMIELTLFEPGGGNWADSWSDLAKQVVATCNANRSKVGHLRISCHGNDGTFAIGASIFGKSNADKWMPIVSQIASYFVPGVSFVTIDACRVAQDSEVLQLFSKALGGVDVRGYMEIQDHSTSEENGRGPSVTCHMEVCKKSGAF